MLRLIVMLLMCGSGSTRYRVKIEDPAIKHYYLSFALDVAKTLSSSKGWGREVSFCPLGEPQFDIVLALPDTVDEMCYPLNTGGKVSCANRKVVVINFLRWTEGDSSWSSLDDYKTYVINHEVGHALGMFHREECEDGKAPLMMQQSQRTLKCKTNPYPTDKEMRSFKKWRAN